MNKELIKEINEAVNPSENLGIFIDYDNIYYGLKDFALNAEDEKYNVINFLWKIYNKYNAKTVRAYADFDQVKVKLRELQKNRVQIRQVYGNGLGEQFRKNASDIELSIDAMESCYKEKIDTYVFITADSDMIPIMSRMIFKGKQVHLYYLGTNTSQYQDITNYTNLSYDLIEILEIDINRNNSVYWEVEVIEHLRNWYKDTRNQGKLYGAKWLSNDLQDKYFMSYKLSSKIIEYLEEQKKIIKHKMGIIEGYVIPDYFQASSSK